MNKKETDSRDFDASHCSSSSLIKSEIHKAKSGRYDTLWDDDRTEGYIGGLERALEILEPEWESLPDQAEKKEVAKMSEQNEALVQSDCSTLDGKWSISTNEEEYHGVFDSMEDAIAEGKASKYGSFYVGRCVSPVQPEVLFTGDAIEDWLERHVWSHDEYSHDWAEGHVCPTSDEMAELADEIRPLIAAWLDRCKLRPTFWNIDPASVRKIDA